MAEKMFPLFPDRPKIKDVLKERPKATDFLKEAREISPLKDRPKPLQERQGRRRLGER